MTRPAGADRWSSVHMGFGTLLLGSLRDMNDLNLETERALYVAHEVSQPLTAVLTNAGAALRWLTLEPANVHEARSAIEEIIGASRRAACGLQCLHVSGGPCAWAPSDVDVNAVITSVLDLLSLDIRRHGVEVETEFTDGLRPIRGGRGQLECVVSNLIRNAIDAMSEVEGKQRKLRIRTQSDKQGEVLTAVEDSGTGIQPRDAKRIFDPFFTTKRGGMGAGLWISRSIVEAYGGRLWATPNLPKGSIFKFVIPA